MAAFFHVIKIFIFTSCQVILLFSLQTVHVVGAWSFRQNNSSCHPFMHSDEDKRSKFFQLSMADIQDLLQEMMMTAHLTVNLDEHGEIF